MNDPTKNNHVEDELNAIRIKLYEQTKDMSTQERVAFFNKLAREGLSRHGVKAKYADAPVAQGQP